MLLYAQLVSYYEVENTPYSWVNTLFNVTFYYFELSSSRSSSIQVFIGSLSLSMRDLVLVSRIAVLNYSFWNEKLLRVGVLKMHWFLHVALLAASMNEYELVVQLQFSKRSKMEWEKLCNSLKLC